jgi:hypothetical protein
MSAFEGKADIPSAIGTTKELFYFKILLILLDFHSA